MLLIQSTLLLLHFLFVLIECLELQNRSVVSMDDLSSLDSWAQSVISRSSLGSSMSLASTCTAISSANTTPGGSPNSTPNLKKKKFNLKPALKLNMDNNTWTTTKHKRRRHKYKKNLQASVSTHISYSFKKKKNCFKCKIIFPKE